ncbi:MAG: DegT/DnrJ/EryC1/StrS family aminotransferase [Candidatus Glassbacteria bacterium]|nr:DegT/DnrJ/EryC1/StrS family aminotransferase [Candidatus Glassbacteria bacterium]
MAKLAIKGGTPVRSEPYPVWPVWDNREVEAVQRVVESGKWGMAQGSQVKELQSSFARYQDARFGIAASSGSTALRASLLAAGLEAGAEVIVPAYTFVASATCVLESNGVPVFADVDPETYVLDAASVEKVITERTAAIMPVHLAGIPVDMDALERLAAGRGIVIIEDACQAWGSEYKGKKMGALGLAGAFSFQSSKHITAGEGGIVVSNDEGFAERCASVVNCGRSTGGAWHTHVRLGGNYRLSELQAAVILVQLERYEKMLARRQEAARTLAGRLSAIDGIKVPVLPDYATACSWHFLALRYDPEAFGGLPKADFIKALNAEGIKPAHGGYYTPVYRQQFLLEKNVGPYDEIRRHRFGGKVIDYADFQCPVAERACSSEAVWLLQNLLLAGQEGLEDIVRAVEKIRENNRELSG